MSLTVKILLGIIIVLAIVLVVLYFLGKKAEKRQAEQQEKLDAAAQTVSMLVIDKKRMKLKEAGFPAVVIENTPKYLRRSKVPVVKAKIGPRIMTLMCDATVFPVLPIKKEVKVVVSGIYITEVKGARGGLEIPVKKKDFSQDLEKKNRLRYAIYFLYLHSRTLRGNAYFNSALGNRLLIYFQMIENRCLDFFFCF